MAKQRSFALSKLFVEQKLNLKNENMHSQKQTPVCLLCGFQVKKSYDSLQYFRNFDIFMENLSNFFQQLQLHLYAKVLFYNLNISFLTLESKVYTESVKITYFTNIKLKIKLQTNITCAINNKGFLCKLLLLF